MKKSVAVEASLDERLVKLPVIRLTDLPFRFVWSEKSLVAKARVFQKTALLFA